MKKRTFFKYNHGTLSFTTGRFDDWAVYVEIADWPKWPKDEWYFTKLKRFALFLGEQKVLDDFKKIYDMTTSAVDENVLKEIKAIAKGYPTPWEAAGIFGILYGGMIAEENKENAVLKKRMKMLGVHQILIEGFTARDAAEFSKGKNWKELVMECHSRGF